MGNSSKTSPSRLRNYAKISFIIIGIVWGAIIAFFATGSLFMMILRGPIPSGNVGTAFLILSFGGGAFLGGCIGYLVYKKSKYSKLEHYQPFY